MNSTAIYQVIVYDWPKYVVSFKNEFKRYLDRSKMTKLQKIVNMESPPYTLFLVNKFTRTYKHKHLAEKYSQDKQAAGYHTKMSQIAD
jgi:hypothetical protein